MEERIPQYLHQPVQILWWDGQEFIALWIMLIFVVIMKPPLWVWGLFLVGAYYFSGWSADKPRGYLLHLAYKFGFVRMRGYPVPAAIKFAE
jgi:type IV conjugative transfer system protein TraL